MAGFVYFHSEMQENIEINKKYTNSSNYHLYVKDIYYNEKLFETGLLNFQKWWKKVKKVFGMNSILQWEDVLGTLNTSCASWDD